MDIEILEKLNKKAAGPSMKFFDLKYVDQDDEFIRFIASFRRVVSKYDSFDYTVLFFNGIHPKSLKSFNYDT